MKKPDTLVREFVRRVSDEDLRFLNTRFRRLVEGDRAEIANAISQDKEMDRWLSTAESAEEWFTMLDSVSFHINKELRRRSSPVSRSKKDNGVAVEV